MRIAIIALTKNGSEIARKIKSKLGGDVYVKEKYAHPGDLLIDGEFIPFVHRIFRKYDGLVFVMAAGIVVRAIAGVIEDKHKDPAVVVVDEKGLFAISLLSGHVGGANELAKRVAEILEAQPVITTATDVEKVVALDVFAKEEGYLIENEKDLKKVSAALVNGEKVKFVVEDEKALPKLKEYIYSVKEEEAKAFVFVTNRKIKKSFDKPYVILVPRNIVLGIGCRKNVEFERLFEFVKETFNNLELNIKSVKSIATIDLKKDEEAILKLREALEVPVVFYTKEELKEVESKFPVSDFVFQTVGVGSVSRPSAYLASGRGRELVYIKKDGITLAVYQSKDEE